jgi:hypothetical protein
VAARNCKVDLSDTRVGGGGTRQLERAPARQVSQCAPCSVLPNEPKNSHEISHMRFYSALPRSQTVRPDGHFRSHSATGTAYVDT